MLGRIQAHALQFDADLLVSADIDSTRRVLQGLPAQSRVVIVGGDGSLHQWLPELVEGPFSVGLVPLGTGNDTARALGLRHLSWKQALTHALTAPAQACDLGQLEVEDLIKGQRLYWFISSLAAGFDAEISARAQPTRFGLPRYLAATLLAIRDLRCQRMQLHVDGQDWPAAEVVLASALNTRTYGSGMPMTPDASMHDGKLNLVQIQRFSRLGLLGMLPLMLIGKHRWHHKVKHQMFQSLRAQCAVSVALAVDGEPVPSASRWQVRVVPAALQVVDHLGS